MSIFVGDRLHISFLGRCFGQRIILGMDYRCRIGTGPGTTYTQDANAIRNAIIAGGPQDLVTPYLACLPPQYNLETLRIQTYQPVRLAYVAFDVNSPGNNDDAASVANDSAAITMRTELAGRRFRGTKHIGPAPDAASVAGLLTAAYVEDLNEFATALLVEIAPAANAMRLVPVVYHKATNTSDDLTSFTIGRQSRVQRRRTVGLGE